MKKDIEFPKVTDVGVAVVLEKNEIDEEVWNVYILNLKEEELEGVLVSARGYGIINNEGRTTSELRHFLDKIPAKSFMKIEPIVEEVFPLNNEYWVSFFLNGTMYDRKYIFLSETIHRENFVKIPLLEKQGVLIL